MTTREQSHADNYAKSIDVLSVGEALIDFISDREREALGDVLSFTMYPGGEVTNVALNVARLGGAASLVACVGNDSFGVFLRQHLHTAGVDTSCLHTATHAPTTLVTVVRSRTTPDFTAYRGADTHLLPTKMPIELLSSVSLVHTSTFALAYEPSRSTILHFIKQAHAAGCLISFEPNYHPRLWEREEDAHAVLAAIYPYVYVTKPSLDDCERLFGAGLSPEDYAARILALGARNVVLTMGGHGVLVTNAEGTNFYPPHAVNVVDVTGAGDAFWSGLLLAILDGYTIADAVYVAQAVAEMKIQQVGPLSHAIDRKALYKQLGLMKQEA